MLMCRMTVSAIDDDAELEGERGRVLCFGGVFSRLEIKMNIQLERAIMAVPSVTTQKKHSSSFLYCGLYALYELY
jgi:hypothetical protein